MAAPAVVSGRRMYAVSHCHYPYNTEVFRVFFYLPPLTSIRYISMFFFFTEVVSEPCQAQAGLLVFRMDASLLAQTADHTTQIHNV